MKFSLTTQVFSTNDDDDEIFTDNKFQNLDPRRASSRVKILTWNVALSMTSLDFQATGFSAVISKKCCELFANWIRIAGIEVVVSVVDFKFNLLLVIHSVSYVWPLALLHTIIDGSTDFCSWPSSPMKNTWIWDEFTGREKATIIVSPWRFALTGIKISSGRPINNSKGLFCVIKKTKIAKTSRTIYYLVLCFNQFYNF